MTREADGAHRPPAPGSLSRRLGFAETTIELGPTHPGVRRATEAAGGAASFIVELDDDRITNLEVEIGYGHRGFEKQVEQGGWADALPYVARLGWSSGVLAETAYCLAVEALAGLVPPDRAIWGRMLVGELARVTDHFARLGATLAAIGLRDAEAVVHAAEAEAARALAVAAGAGPIAGYVCLGGVRHGFDPVFAEAWPRVRKALDEALARFDAGAARNPTCTRRLRDVAVLGVDDARAWGVTGIALRAAGGAEDVRRTQPYLAYPAVAFDVPVGERGDALDRMLVVAEEIRQSLAIVDQCHKLLASLGPGDLGEPITAVVASPGETVATVESSTGALAFLIVADEAGRPGRIRCRAPSFFHAQVLPLMLRGARLDDLLPTVAGLHIVGPECDR